MLNPDPDKFYTLPDAFDVLGREHYRDIWAETEIAARKLPPPKATFRILEEAKQELDQERRAKNERAKRAATGVGVVAHTSRRPPPPGVIERRRVQEIARYVHLEPEIVAAASDQETYEKEYGARTRRETTERKLRRLLYGSDIPTVLLNSQDGRLVDIDSSFWLADKFTVDFASGQASWADLEEGQQVTYQGVVLVDRPEFDRVAMNTQPLKSKPSKMRRRSGRKRGSGSLTALDKPLLAEMNKMIIDENAVSIWAAALKMAPEAAGAGVIESKAKRLARRYREQQN